VAKIKCAGCGSKFQNSGSDLPPCPNCERKNLFCFLGENRRFECLSCKMDWSVIPCPKCGTGISVNSVSACYVATCVYGSYDCPEVLTLRRFRDNSLSTSFFGRCFIRAYYAVSPRVVAIFGKKEWFHKLFRPVLNKLVHMLSKRT
jgi:hypothetical protein